MVVNGSSVAGKLELGKPYVLRDLDGLAALGVTGAATDANKYLYQCVELFYAEAGKGAELWVMVVASATLPSAMLDPNLDNAKKLVRASKGRVRTVLALTSATATVAENAALGSDVATATIGWRDGQPVMEGFSSITIDGEDGRGDVNYDGKIDVADIAKILSMMAGTSAKQAP